MIACGMLSAIKLKIKCMDLLIHCRKQKAIFVFSLYKMLCSLELASNGDQISLSCKLRTSNSSLILRIQVWHPASVIGILQV